MFDGLKGVVPILIYLAVWASVFAAIFWRAEIGVMMLVFLMPQPNLWYPIHQFTFGKDTTDLLALSTFLGIIINKGGFQASASRTTIWVYIIITYAATWNSALRFGLPIPISSDSFILREWKNFVILPILYFLTFSAVRDEHSARRIVLLALVVVLIIGLRETRSFVAGSSFSYETRAMGSFWMVGLNANHFAAFLAHYMCLAIGMLIIDRDRKRSALYVLLVGFCLFPLFYAYSRGAYVALLFGLAVFGAMRKPSILLAIALFAFTWQDILPESVVDRVTMTENADGELEDSAAQRLVVWDHAERLFKDNPVFGVGYLGFSIVRSAELLQDPHNFYLKVAAEQGVIGLFSLALVFIKAWWSGWRLFRSSASLFARGLGLGFLGSVSAMLVTNAFGDRFSYISINCFFFVLFAIVDRLRVLNEEMGKSTSKLNAALLTDPKWTKHAVAPQVGDLTLPAENVSLAECFNASKENGNDEEDDEGAVHARVQARGGAAGRGRAEHCSGGADVGRGRSDAVQLGQGAAAGQAQGR